MNNQIAVDLECYLADCFDIAEDQMDEVIGMVVDNFNYSDIYSQIDELVCGYLREEESTED
jgi:hypothetical protein